MLLAPASVLAENNTMYRFELGAQVGAAYYMGELAPHPFMSTSETYGLQARCKINDRWAVQLKAQSQRVMNQFEVGNQWNVPANVKYQTPMWHFDITGEYNFFHYGFNAYDIKVRNFTPYIFAGFGFTFLNDNASFDQDYPILGRNKVLHPNDSISWERTEMDVALSIPVGVGFKWRFAPRWQLQVAWQHNLYIYNGDGLEGEIVPRTRDKKDGDYDLFNNAHGMNGINIFNNDVTSTITVGVVFEFLKDPGICVLCR